MVKPFVQRIRINLFRVGIICLIPLIFIVRPTDASLFAIFLKYIGATLLTICVLGRMWCCMYIGGRKNKEVIAEGPYSLCRHPLYLFSIIGAAGFGLMLGTLTMALLFTILAYIGLSITAKKEEEYLLSEYGKTYQHLIETVPMIFPKSMEIKTTERTSCKHSAMCANFRDSMGWLSTFLVIAIVEISREIIPLSYAIFTI